MKIFYWAPFNSRTGVVDKVLNSIQAIKKYGNSNINITLLNATGEWNDSTNKLKLINANILNLLNFNLKLISDKKGFFWSRFYYFLIFILCFLPLFKVIKKEKPNYLFCQLVTSLPLFISLFFFKNTKFILNISGFPKIHFLRSFFWKLTSKKIYKICCPTVSTFNYILSLNIFDPKKIILLKDPIFNISVINKQKKEIIEEKLIDEKFILSVGRLTYQKNHKILINAFKEISINYPELKLVILGDGEKKDELLNLINNLGIKDKVLLLGYKKNIYNYISNSLCVINTSLWEDPGFVMIMSAASNKIFISSDCPSGPADFIGRDEKAGYLFTNNSFDSLVEIILKFLKEDKNKILNKVIIAKKRSNDYTFFKFFLSFRNNFIDNI
jgi:glycosyltransferase involved in cell wall biosynthesis